MTGSVVGSQLPNRYTVIDSNGFITKPWSLWFNSLINSLNISFTFSANALVFTNSSGVLESQTALNGQIAIGNSTGVPIIANITGTANEVIVTNGAGSITLGTPQAIATTSSVTFANITDTALTDHSMIFANSGGLLSSTSNPLNGQLLIGSTGGNPILANISAGSGLSIVNAAGSITISNSGATSLTAGAGIGLSASTGAITVSNTGVLSNIGGTGISISGATGNSTITNTGVTSAVAGTGISVSAATGAVTFSNAGVTSLTAGTGITLSGSTGAITVSTGSGFVTSLTGTANEVIVSASTGAVTLSTPQAIATTSTPTFGGLTLTPLTGYLFGNASSAITASSTIPNTSITGLGTMSTQNASSVAITGGAINGTTIGATTAAAGTFTSLTITGGINNTAIGNTTPSTGVFTTLDATGQTSLGGTVGAEGLRVLNTASSVNYVQISGNTTGNGAVIQAAGGDTNITLALSSKGTGPISFNTNGNALVQAQILNTASATRSLTFTGSNGGNPTISASAGNVAFGTGIVPVTTTGIIGTATNDSANTGSFGEYLTASTTGTNLPNATAVNATSLALTAGDWDVQAVVHFNPAAGGVLGFPTAGVATASTTLGAFGTFVQLGATHGAGAGDYAVTPVVRVSLASGSTVYAYAGTNLTGGTATCDGFLRARRVR